MWKIEPGKADCFGNISWYRVYHRDDYWNCRIVDGTRAAAKRVADGLNANVILFRKK